MDTLYWHDYETFGRDPAKDRLAQFAGIRTDTDLKIVGKPTVIYCKLTKDIVPDPGACFVTGITPQIVNSKGVTEAKFMAQVYDELSQSKTCSVGYNSSNFDDEFTRYALYRNFFNPYDHHSDKFGNSRWDLINVVRLIRVFNPDGPLVWPKKDDGKYSTRLEDLTSANGIKHDAHDALADVKATIELARLIRKHHRKVFDYCYQQRTKKMALELLGINRGQLKSPKPLLHVDSFYGSDNNYIGIVYPVALHPNKGNSVIVYNVMKDPTPLLELPARELREKLFTKKEDREDGEERVGMHEINANKCPVIIPLDKVSSEAAERLGIDKQICFARVKTINNKRDVPYVAQAAYSRSFEDRTDPELMLYDGFFEKNDKERLVAVRKTAAKELGKTNFHFEDPRLSELLFRYRARNFPSTLTKAEKVRWDDYCKRRWHDPEGGGSLTLEQFYTELEQASQGEPSKEKKEIIKALRAYAEKTFVI